MSPQSAIRGSIGCDHTHHADSSSTLFMDCVMSPGSHLDQDTRLQTTPLAPMHNTMSRSVLGQAFGQKKRGHVQGQPVQG